MLQSETFNLLSVDLNMPKMDGLQVLSIARRKYPQLRLVVLTGIRDEQFRTRAYGLGVDQYWIKPESDQEMGLLMESFESLLSQEIEGGFRGIQSKSLVDIIQLECLSQNSCLLRICNRAQEAKIWIHAGDVIDAEMNGDTGEAGFQKILKWKTGFFEILPSDPDRTRTIFASYQGLLLNTAQALDEANAAAEGMDLDETESGEGSEESERKPRKPTNRAPMLAELAQLPGVEFVLVKDVEAPKATSENFGLEDPGPMNDWAMETLKDFHEIGDTLQAGTLQHAIGTTPKRKLALVTNGETDFCVGLTSTLPIDHCKDVLKGVLAKWGS